MACIKNCLQLRANVEYLHTPKKKWELIKTSENITYSRLSVYYCYYYFFLGLPTEICMYVHDVAISALHDTMTFVDRKINNIVTENTKSDGKEQRMTERKSSTIIQKCVYITLTHAIY